MITSRGATEEGRGPEKVNIESRKKNRGFVLLLPVVTALPVIAALTYATLRYGNVIHKLISIVIKMAVTA